MIKNNPIDSLIAEGDNLINQGYYDKAISVYLKALDENPNNQDILYNLANTYFVAEKPNKVVLTLEKLLLLNPKYHKAYYLLAKTYFVYMHNHNKAIKNILKAIEQCTENSFYYSLAAQVFYSIDNPAKALKLSEDAIKLDPDNYEAHLVLGSYYKRNNDTNKSVEHYTIGLKTGPDYSDSYFLLNLLHLELAKDTVGNKLIKDALALYPDNDAYQWLFKYSYLRNHPLNFPLILIDNFSVKRTQIIPLLIGFGVLVALMFWFEWISIEVISIFKWACSIVFIVFMPYQLIVYLLLNIYYNIVVSHKIAQRNGYNN